MRGCIVIRECLYISLRDGWGRLGCFVFEYECMYVSTKIAKLQNAKKKNGKRRIHTTAGIRWWSPTQLLIYRSEAYVWQSGRDAQCSSVYGRMWQSMKLSWDILW